MLLAYFDETAPKCGVCDICLEEKRRKNKAESTDNITAEIVESLSIENMNIGELVTALKTGSEKERLEAIRLLLDAGKIKTDGEKYYL